MRRCTGGADTKTADVLAADGEPMNGNVLGGAEVKCLSGYLHVTVKNDAVDVVCRQPHDFLAIGGDYQRANGAAEARARCGDVEDVAVWFRREEPDGAVVDVSG